MKVAVKEPFESKKIIGKMIPPGIYDISDDWAKELIKKGIAEPTEKLSGDEEFKIQYNHYQEVETREEEPIKKKTKK